MIDERSRRCLVEAPPILALSIQRIDHDSVTRTGRRNHGVIRVDDEITLPMSDGGKDARYRLASAIQGTTNHFVALLKYEVGKFIKVDDAKVPVLVGPKHIGSAEFYFYTKMQNRK